MLASIVGPKYNNFFIISHQHHYHHPIRYRSYNNFTFAFNFVYDYWFHISICVYTRLDRPTASSIPQTYFHLSDQPIEQSFLVSCFDIWKIWRA